jgi:prepilin-type N-terminal cleavage/methylation domain-containing protein
MGTVRESIKRKIKSITNFKERFEKGFTLLEVTVTILLIGLFAAISTGTYNEV